MAIWIKIRISDNTKHKHYNVLDMSKQMTKALPQAKHKQHWLSHKCFKYAIRLLTLVQVGDCWKYVLEAIILYYYISIIHN
jgi:hypothetical protein